jgi:hypothetical protein
MCLVSIGGCEYDIKNLAFLTFQIKNRENIIQRTIISILTVINMGVRKKENRYLKQRMVIFDR